MLSIERCAGCGGKMQLPFGRTICHLELRELVPPCQYCHSCVRGEYDKHLSFCC